MNTVILLQGTGQYIGSAAYHDVFAACFAAAGAILLGIGGYLCRGKC